MHQVHHSPQAEIRMSIGVLMICVQMRLTEFIEHTHGRHQWSCILGVPLATAQQPSAYGNMAGGIVESSRHGVALFIFWRYGPDIFCFLGIHGRSALQVSGWFAFVHKDSSLQRESPVSGCSYYCVLA